MKTIDPQEISPFELHGYLLGSVAPRPIAFVSSIDRSGKVNLSPFSYFNIFGTNPPLLIFSPARRVKGNTNKHTLENVMEVKEVVINIVNYAMVEQMSLASTEYDKGINEFLKAGLTPVASQRVLPPRVKESPVALECKVTNIIETGNEGGAGNLIFCEVVLMHVNENILDNDSKVIPQKLDAVARMGGNWYCRAYGDALFEIAKPTRLKGMGIDQLPSAILKSDVLTGNDLARLAGVETLPSEEEILDFKKNDKIQSIIKNASSGKEKTHAFHTLAKSFLLENNVKDALLTLMQSELY